MAARNSRKGFGVSQSFKGFQSSDSTASGAPSLREYDQQIDFVFATQPPKSVVGPRKAAAAARKRSSAAKSVIENLSELKTTDFVNRDVYGRCEQTVPGDAPNC
eukprot:CAMPEP_0185829690 /NCGR_PEP_ID=MMETSP1353-20130828/398_1 /TAXON_ID=1077150 /ORGANISM="Erythrolobus australicus, Strain CCMP3124" /LENGTH=103 /DNA_ID=CAMNT_0028527509 /DNA_START=57 /DNA_END=368 /DNA_ORIENTATION=+